jgi:hypothetical protein
MDVVCVLLRVEGRVLVMAEDRLKRETLCSGEMSVTLFIHPKTRVYV